MKNPKEERVDLMLKRVDLPLGILQLPATMKTNRIKLFFGLAACISLMAIGCSKGSDEPEVTAEQAAQNAESEADQAGEMEGYDAAGSADNRKE